MSLEADKHEGEKNLHHPKVFSSLFSLLRFASEIRSIVSKDNNVDKTYSYPAECFVKKDQRYWAESSQKVMSENTSAYQVCMLNCISNIHVKAHSNSGILFS